MQWALVEGSGELQGEGRRGLRGLPGEALDTGRGRGGAAVLRPVLDAGTQRRGSARWRGAPRRVAVVVVRAAAGPAGGQESGQGGVPQALRTVGGRCGVQLSDPQRAGTRAGT